MSLKIAINRYRADNTDHDHLAVEAFIALYSMLGSEELYDGIATAMQDEGYDEEYEDIMGYYAEAEEEL